MVIFSHASGWNVCTCIYMSNSLTTVIDVIVFLINCDLNHFIVSVIKTKMLRNKTRLFEALKIREMCDGNANETTQAGAISFAEYSSDTIEDLHFELETLMRVNVNNFFNIFRLSFKVGTLMMVLQTYEIQLLVVLYSFKTILQLLYHIITFISAMLETYDYWSSYDSLSDDEMKPILLQYASRSRKCNRSRECNSRYHKTRSATTTSAFTSRKNNVPHRKTRKVKNGCCIDNDKYTEQGDHGTNEVCAICLSAPNVETVKLKSCQHQFHEGCLLCLLRVAKNDKAKKCPICRARIIPGNSLWQDQHDDEVAFLIPRM